MSSDDEDDRIFKALGNRVRRRMLDRLKNDPQTTGALCAQFPELDRCTVMQHLGVLEDAGLVVARREGRERWNHLNAIPLQALHERWIGAYAEHAADRLLQLSRGLGP
jgi:DNA-binding transcriptional ArsR family regulator